MMLLMVILLIGLFFTVIKMYQLSHHDKHRYDKLRKNFTKVNKCFDGVWKGLVEDF